MGSESEAGAGWTCGRSTCRIRGAHHHLPDATPEPVYIECEGSGCPTHYPANLLGTCRMCGQEVSLDHADGWAVKHQRLHVLAMYGRMAAKEAGL